MSKKLWKDLTRVERNNFVGKHHTRDIQADMVNMVNSGFHVELTTRSATDEWGGEGCLFFCNISDPCNRKESAEHLGETIFHAFYGACYNLHLFD